MRTALEAIRARARSSARVSTGGCWPQRWVACTAWAALVTALWLSPAESAAQTITLTENEINRIDGDDAVPLRRTGQRPNWISYKDCVDDRQFSFPVRVSQTGFRLEVWAGTDNCAERRGQQDRGQCWIVHQETTSARDTNLQFPARNVVRPNLSAATPPMGLGPEVCEGEAGEPLGQQLTFYILQVSGSAQVMAEVTWVGGQGGTGYDLAGPSPPGNISVGVGENQLSVQLDGVDEDADRARYRLFCVPATPTAATPSTAATPPDAGDIDAGTGTEGTDTSTPEVATTPPACMQSELRENDRPPLDTRYECGEGSDFSTSLQTSANLENGQLYAIAVAGEDLMGNAGPVSQVLCATPRELTDFFELYKSAGGAGGGGFCAVALPRSHRGGSTTASWLLLAGGALLARRGVRRAPLRCTPNSSPKEPS